MKIANDRARVLLLARSARHRRPSKQTVMDDDRGWRRSPIEGDNQRSQLGWKYGETSVLETRSVLTKKRGVEGIPACGPVGAVSEGQAPQECGESERQEETREGKEERGERRSRKEVAGIPSRRCSSSDR